MLLGRWPRDPRTRDYLASSGGRDHAIFAGCHRDLRGPARRDQLPVRQYLPEVERSSRCTIVDRGSDCASRYRLTLNHVHGRPRQAREQLVSAGKIGIKSAPK